MLLVLWTAIGLLASTPAMGASKASVSEAFTAGSGPYIGNSISAGVSPSSSVDLDLGYDFGTDQDLVVFHSIWGSLGLFTAEGVRFSIDGDFGPRASSDTASRGHYALSSGGGGASLSYHPGREGDVRPYFQVGGGIEHLNVEGSQTPGDQNPVSGSFNQTSVGGTAGGGGGTKPPRGGGSEVFFQQNAPAPQFSPGGGNRPLA